MGWREMREADLPRVMEIAVQLHPNYPERIEVFAERLALFPQGCRFLSDGTGYAFAHPILAGRPPALDSLLGQLPPQADCLHLHDLALLPQARGQGHAAALLDYLSGLGLSVLSLVAVSGTADYWGRFGFAPAEAHDLDSYGDGIYLARQ